MIKYFVLLFTPFYLFALYNPYLEIDKKDKVNILINYFINESIKKVLPLKPIRDKKIDNSIIKKVKSEEYFAFIQRVKNIKEKREKDKILFDKEYKEKIERYNSKIDKLKEFYSKDKNIEKLLENSFNKSFIIVYGKPRLQNIYFNNRNNKVMGKLFIENIFTSNDWGINDIFIDVPKKLKDRLLKYYQIAKARLEFDYKNNIAILKGIKIYLDREVFNGTFVKNIDYKIKIKIKIDKTLFKKVIYDRDK